MTAKLKFNHLSFPTQNTQAEAAFFVRYFGAKIEFTTPEGIVLLKQGEMDIVLESTNDQCIWLKDFHFGFELDTKLQVEQMFTTLKNDGVVLDTNVFNRVGRGSRFFGRTPGGVQFEINTREDMNEKWKKPQG